MLHEDPTSTEEMEEKLENQEIIIINPAAKVTT
jgi:hypothetical protein